MVNTNSTKKSQKSGAKAVRKGQKTLWLQVRKKLKIKGKIAFE